ncbi:hypothetical protein ACP4OV_001254 [Aristida adscensionis]
MASLKYEIPLLDQGIFIYQRTVDDVIASRRMMPSYAGYWW